MLPAGALRPLLRPARKLLPEQTSSLLHQVRNSSPSSPWTRRPRHKPSICLACSVPTPQRLYSTAAPSNPPNPPQRRPPPELPSTTESRRSPLSTRFSTSMDNLQSRVFAASQTLNDLTGYSAIEAIKAANTSLEAQLSTAQTTLQAARHTYKDIHARRAATQREVTALLARKDAWAPADLERFTNLYRADHEVEAAVARAAEELTEAEGEESRLSRELNQGMLRRYHEEQVWSDRIRRQSTWGTWGLMGVNVVLFLVLQFVAEPWKRGRLVSGVAEVERGVLEELRGEIGEVKKRLGEREEGGKAGGGLAGLGGRGDQGMGVEASRHPDGIVSPWKEVLIEPKQWKRALVDLYSERRIDLRMRDASLIALEGAVAGATLMVGIAVVFLRRA